MKLDYRLDKWDYLLLTSFFLVIAIFIIPSLDAGYNDWYRSVLAFILEMLIAIPLTIINVKYLMPYFFNKNRIWYYFPALVILVAPFIFIYNWFVTIFWMNEPEILANHGYKLGRIGIFIWALLRHITIMSLVLIIRRLVDAKKNIKSLELEKKKLELEMLKTQINPHFYFNTLNNLYSLVISNSAKTPNVILQLSNLMEYVIYDCKNEFVELTKEISFINNYIELQKIRYEDSAEISFESNFNNIKNVNLKIIPMLLIQFIENAFKHANINEENSFLIVRIEVDENILYLNIQNTFQEKNKIELKNIDGIGLINSKNRLDNYYINNYEINIQKSLDELTNFSIYKLELKIIL